MLWFVGVTAMATNPEISRHVAAGPVRTDVRVVWQVALSLFLVNNASQASHPDVLTH